MKNRKSLFALVICLLLSAGLMAQETKPAQKKIHIQIEKNVNGEMTRIDTVLTVQNDAEAHNILKNMELDPGNIETVNVMKFKGGDDDVIIIRQRDAVGSGEAVEKVWIDDADVVHKIGEGDGKHFIMIQKGELSEEQMARMKEAMEKGEGLQQEITVDVSQDADGKTVRTIRIMSLRAEIKDLEAADIKQLSETGADASRLKNTLEVADLSFYPNPNDGRFTLRFSAPESGATAVRIFDTTGRTVYEEKLGDFSGAYEKQIDISAEAKGVYFLTISQNDKLLNKKIVLE